ncbi:MAG: glutathione S-transferase, partial [Porticoccaceae bacterium]|nr:glutathione S-transferase [Porticoccaceae bacterium]
REHYQVFASSSISAAVRGEKYFTLDLGDGAFVARSMRRLEKARLHVQDELLRVGAEKSSLRDTGVLSFYLQPSMFD